MKLSWKRLTVTTLTLATVGLASGSVHAGSGGPDAAGYIYFDNAEGNVALNAVNLTGNPATVLPFGDLNGQEDQEAVYTFPAGFTFDLYGETLSSIVISSEGFFSGVGGTPAPAVSCPYPNDDGLAMGPRVYVHHANGANAVQAATFDATDAAALGFIDTVGVTIVQWTVLELPGGAFFEVGAVLYHGSGVVEIQQRLAAGAGAASGTGIENGAGDTALTYSCDPLGVTAIQFRPGGVPEVRINEIRIDQTGDDNDEYVELVGPPNASLDGMRLFVVGDGTGGAGSGTIEAFLNLNGRTLNDEGLFLIGEDTMTLGTPDWVTTLNFENNDNVTFFLVFGAEDTVVNGFDLDGPGGGDGVLDSTPWSLELDRVAMIEDASPLPLNTEFHYGPPSCPVSETCQVAGPNGTAVPWHTFRCENANGTFLIGNDDPLLDPIFDSPGALNPCTCGDGLVIPSEDCDESGETATCDDDCTLVECGDGNVNEAAAEECDDSGESTTCDFDCTAAMCGDGTINMTALEDCDDVGESATCDIDCTTAMCGDGTLNVTAGELCDDGGESPTCNADCTVAVCGDNIVNTMAGETCDDGGRSDMCNADCTAASCGDGILNATAGEQCDDAGVSETCDADCTDAVCGDGNLNTLAGEVCDDGNKDDGDGCDSTCLEEAGTTGDTDSGSGSDSGSGDTTDTDPTDTADSSGGDTTGSAETTGTPTTTSTSSTTAGGETGGGTGTDTDGDTGGAADDGGCGCSTDNTPPGWAAFGLFGLLGFRRRRSA